ncbi:uncharacterized protein RSE6_01712 [Rhynchosporium secalis]|uniref:Uncharacterized protein n=1 Tax=Rhynchosporium secalis TaxID=38038 RepID=A0A1E1LYG6_RHYSE|nr:uncharacterized protein RSE6_01712 [Rhynchosporium secalis]
MADEQSHFMRAPSEIRLMIYSLLFDDDDRNERTFEIRHQNPDLYKRRAPHVRSHYRVLGRDLLRQSQTTTYQLVTDVQLHVSIMGVNRKIHEETTHILYGNRSFSFGRDIEAVVPFFSDMTKQTRSKVQEISLLKQGSVYSRDYDRCEWSNMCDFLREHMQLNSFKLTVEGGRPALGWEGLPEYSASDFKTLSNVRYEPLEWVWEVLSIKGIRNVEVFSEINHCPPSHSTAMAFFAAFSSSIEKGFSDFLRSELLVEA